MRNSVWLGYYLGVCFDAQTWDKLTTIVAFHKLTYNIRKSVVIGAGNYYWKIMGIL